MRRLSSGPLGGLTVLVTRPRERAPELSRELRRAGAEAIERPTIRIEPPADPSPLHDAVRSLDRYDWLVLTSVSGVVALRQALMRERVTVPVGDLRTAAIGSATARALEAAGLRVDLVPEGFIAEALADALVGRVAGADPAGDGSVARLRVLLPRAAEARRVLPDRLRAAGAEVDEIAAYRTVPETSGREALVRTVGQGGLDWITFTSSSTARGYVDLVGPGTGGARVAAIGPITADTVRELGLPVDAVAARHTSRGLVRALAEVETTETGAPR